MRFLSADYRQHESLARVADGDDDRYDSESASEVGRTSSDDEPDAMAWRELMHDSRKSNAHMAGYMGMRTGATRPLMSFAVPSGICDRYAQGSGG